MISKLLKPAQQFVQDNTPVILTGAGVVGVVATTILTGKATVKATDILATEKAARKPTGGVILPDEPVGARDITKTDAVKLVYKEYIPVAVVLVGTVGCIIMANRISAKEVAAMAAAYGLTQDKFADYRTKVQEHFGAGKEQKVRDEIAQDKVTAHGPTKGNIIVTGNGDVLCLDTYSARYFECNVETIKRAENTINERILREDSASLSDFYDEIGLDHTGFSDAVGWNTKNLIETDILATVAPDNRPCIVIDFLVHPSADYQSRF